MTIRPRLSAPRPFRLFPLVSPCRVPPPLALFLLLVLTMKRERVTNVYSGHVQGIGFRYAVRLLTASFEVTGTVRNLPDGRVELVAESAREELEAFLQAIRDSDVGPFIRQEQTRWSEAQNEFRGFEITH